MNTARDVRLGLRIAAVIGACGVVTSAQTPPAPIVGAIASYDVQPGDSLVSLGARWGVDWIALASENGLRPGAALTPGQALTIDGRHIAPDSAADGIVINVPQRMLFVIDRAAVVVAFPIAAGRADWQTPLGTFELETKEINPTWDVPVSIQREMANRGVRVLTRVLPGPENPLGDRWMGLKGAGIGLHGTNVPSSIYRFATHGCIRLHPDDARALFERVSVGMMVRIIYAAVLVTVMGGHVWIEVHPDPYRRAGDLRRAAEARIAALGATGAVDPQLVSRCLARPSGRPCDVSHAGGR